MTDMVRREKTATGLRRAGWWPALYVFLFWNAGDLAAQPLEIPPLGTIDFYGLRTVSESEVQKLLPLQVGFEFTGVLPDSETVRAEIADALGVARVDLNLVCCTYDGLTQLYVGIQEVEQATDLYYAAPTGDVRLPSAVVDNFDEFLDRMMASVLDGSATEDRTQGHALADSGEVRRTQEAFLVQARQEREVLIDVLRHSSSARHRSIAAHVLGYAPDKAAIAPVLASAVLDPDDGVRNYATRSLAIIAEYANANPDRGIAIPPDAFIEMLSSIVWSDRNKSLAVLANLTESRDPELLETLRTTSLASLKEMCEWTHWGHAEPACLILRRMVGLPDDEDVSSRESTLTRTMELIR